MDLISPIGGVYQAGTLSGNPLAMTAGIYTLQELAQKNVYEILQKTTERLLSGLNEILKKTAISFQIQSVGSMWTLFFNPKPVTNFADAKNCDLEYFKQFFHQALNGGVYLPPSPFEAAFVSLAHKNEEIDHTLNVFEHFFTPTKAGIQKNE